MGGIVSTLAKTLIVGKRAILAGEFADFFLTIVCIRSQITRSLGRRLKAMQIKYYTQFQLEGTDYRDSNVFSGIVEFSRQRGGDINEIDIQALLARNFAIDVRDVQLVSWCRLH